MNKLKCFQTELFFFDTWESLLTYIHLRMHGNDRHAAVWTLFIKLVLYRGSRLITYSSVFYLCVCTLTHRLSHVPPLSSFPHYASRIGCVHQLMYHSNNYFIWGNAGSRGSGRRRWGRAREAGSINPLHPKLPASYAIYHQNLWSLPNLWCNAV